MANRSWEVPGYVKLWWSCSSRWTSLYSTLCSVIFANLVLDIVFVFSLVNCILHNILYRVSCFELWDHLIVVACADAVVLPCQITSRIRCVFNNLPHNSVSISVIHKISNFNKIWNLGRGHECYTRECAIWTNPRLSSRSLWSESCENGQFWSLFAPPACI